MATAIDTKEGQAFNRLPAHTASVKEEWSASWVDVPFLYCNRCSKHAYPEIGSAELEYDYGYLCRPNSTGFALVTRQELLHFYVRISIDQYDDAGNAATPIVWIGYIEEEADVRHGATFDESGNRQATGRQTFLAKGMEAFLAREIVRKSIVFPSAGQTALGAELELGRPLGFNVPSARSGDVFEGNRSSVPGITGAYVFSADTAGADPWSILDAAFYLLSYQSPKSLLGNPDIPFALSASAPYQVPEWLQLRLPVSGKESLYDLLGKLISRTRLLGFYVDVDESSTLPDVVIYPFTFCETSIPFGLVDLFANEQLISIDFDEAFDVTEAVIRKSGSLQFDQVLCRGARKGSCFSLSFKDSTLQTDWASSVETAYETAASGAADYPTSWAQQQHRNRLWRSSDTYERVYSWFTVPSSWDGTVKDGENGGSSSPVFVVDDEFAIAAPFYLPGLLLDPYLPLMTDHDYTGANIGDGTVTDNTPSGREPERLRPMAFLKVVSNDGVTRYQHADKQVEGDKTDKLSLGGSQFHCSLRMQDRALGVVLTVHGAPQYAIAKTDFSGQASDAPTPVVDYKDNLIVTVYAKSDHYLEVFFPETATLEIDPDSARVLLIDFGEDGHLDYVAPNTIVGVKDGKLQRSDGGYVRDDRERMTETAELAYQWYSVERQAFTLTWNQITGRFSLGMLITELGAGATLEAVNTPITSIEWDLLGGRTTITTGFAELDALQIAGGLSPRAIGGLGGG